jgi:hypothetical protein
LLALAAAVAAVDPAPAEATDSYPCGKEVSATWTTDPVQPCPLTDPLPPYCVYPVYAQPVPSPEGGPIPETDGWLVCTETQYFVCDKAFPDAIFTHPERGWRNYWWALTRTKDGVWGWVPEVFFRGGDPFEPDYGLRFCPEPGAEDPCTTSPAAEGPELSAHLRRRGSKRARRVVTVPYGHRARVAGRLVGADGTPLAAAQLCVATRPTAAGAKRRQQALIATGEHGRFKYTLPRGPSRRVWFVHRSGGASAVASVLVRVRSSLSLNADPRRVRTGESVVLRGRVRGQRGRGRVLVELQAARGSRWQTFGTARTRRGGRYRFTYRFTRTVGVQRYELRAHVPEQRANPYASGSSRPVRVKVRG